MSNADLHPASFKDPAGFVFTSDGKIYRQVNMVYSVPFRKLMDSGLYQKLVSENKLVSHEIIDKNLTGTGEWYTTLLPQQIPFISYPYEWSFSALRDAALLTLSVMRTAIDYGMVLKDATAYNVQFYKNKPVFIDTLSFDVYDETKPWVAYRQFCQHFLFPLYLEHYLGTDAIRLLSNYIDGIPVDVTAKLLPWRSKWNLGVRLHVLLQHSMKNRNEPNTGRATFSKQKLVHLLSHLEGIIKSLKPAYPPQTTWSNYYDETILGQGYLEEKKKLIEKITSTLSYDSILDLGANDGYFTRLLAKPGKQVIAVDSDSRCIDTLYEYAKSNPGVNILPLVNDLSNPSPAIGFNNRERNSFQQRAGADLVLALALVHHLAIGKNIPFAQLAGWFAGFGPQLIIEFVPREDEKVKQLLSGRDDVFTTYDRHSFEQFFSQYFDIQSAETISGTVRVLYCMKRK